MKTDFNKFENDRKRNNPDNFIWGLFYFNREDSRIFIPKRQGSLGWNLNFANPFSYIFIFVFIVVMVFIDRYLEKR